MSDETSTLHKYPPWLDAAEKIAAEDPPAGTMLSRQYLADLMGIKLPEPDMLYRDAKDLEFLVLNHFTELRKRLGEEFSIRIEARGSDGYEILAPKDQVPLTVSRRERDIRRAMRHLRAEISWVPMDKLSADDRRDAVDALARIGRIGQQLQRRKPDKWLTPPEDET